MGTFFTMSIISLFSITSFLFLEALLEICSAVHIQFIALDKPCLEKYRLCSTHCSVSQLRGDFNCQFCVCDDPKYEIAWPTSTTTAVPLTSTSAPRRTDRPGEWTVNNITYSKLRNPCYQVEANCPVNCKSYNDTMAGTTVLCTRCRCPIDAFNSLRPDEGFGRRRSENIWEISRDILVSRAKKIPVKRSLRKMCMPLFSCPIKRCQPGQTFQLTTLGCPICQCVPIADQVTTTLSPISMSPSTVLSSKLNTNPHFLSLFCKVEPDGCPSDCNVVDYRVGSWHCYHCNCPANSYKALVNPCKDDKFLCPTHCTVRDLTDSRDSSIVCQYCDCGGHHRQRQHTNGKIIKRRRKSALSPFEICKHNCFEDYCRRNMCGHCPVIPFIRPPYVGRRKRQGQQGPVQCGKCVHCMVPPPVSAEFHAQTFSPTPQTTKRVQVVGSPTHKIEVSDEHCLSADLSIFCPAPCSSIHVSKCYYCNCNGRLLPKAFIMHVLGGIGSHLGKPSVHGNHTKTTQTTTTVTYTTLPLVYTTPTSTFLPSTHRPTQPTTSTTRTTTPTTTTGTTSTLPTTIKTMAPTTTRTTTTLPTTIKTMAPTTTRTTTTLPTTIKTMAPSNRKTTTTLPTTIKTMSPKPDSCYLCSGLSCSEKDVHMCPSGQDYCMSTIDQDNQGERIITRACVTEDDCYNKWWIVSADSPTCLSMKNDINGPSGSPEICHFCCKGSLCNKQGRIPDGDLYKGESHPSSGIITIG